MGAVKAEIEYLLKESNIRNPGYFVFANNSMFVCVGSTVYVHGAEVFAKTKKPGFLKKCSISAWTAPIY